MHIEPDLFNNAGKTAVDSGIPGIVNSVYVIDYKDFMPALREGAKNTTPSNPPTKVATLKCK